MSIKLVYLACGQQLSAFEVSCWKDLWQATVESYAPLLDDVNSELALVYQYDGDVLEVKSQATLETFLSLYKLSLIKELPPSVDAEMIAHAASHHPILSVQQRPKLAGIPKLGGSQGATVNVSQQIPRHQVSSRDEAPSWDDEGDLPVQRKNTRKATKPVPTNAVSEELPIPPEVPATPPGEEDSIPVVPSRVPGAGYTVDDTPNCVRAQRLLSSFKPPSNPEGPKVRVVIRDGCKSALVDFDPYNPPDVTTLRQRIWNIFYDVLEKKTTDILATPEGAAAAERSERPIVAKNFLTSFWFDGAHTLVDIEDFKDVKLLGEAIQVYGDCNCVVYVDAPFVNLKAVEPDILTQVVPERSPRGLGVNQCHTPKRDRSTKKSQSRPTSAAGNRGDNSAVDD